MIGGFWREFRKEYDRQRANQRINNHDHASWVAMMTLMAHPDPAVCKAGTEAMLAGTVIGACLAPEQVTTGIIWATACSDILGIPPHEAAIRLIGTIGVGTESLDAALTEMGIDMMVFHRAVTAVEERMAQTTSGAVKPMDDVLERMRMLVDVVRAAQPPSEGG